MVAAAPSDAEALVASLCAMCREILEAPSVNPEDDIFALDPDSLTLQRLNVLIQQAWGVAVPVDVFYDTESIRELADVIVTMRARG